MIPPLTTQPENPGDFQSSCSSTCRRMTQVSHLGHSRLDLHVDLSKVHSRERIAFIPGCRYIPSVQYKRTVSPRRRGRHLNEEYKHS